MIWRWNKREVVALVVPHVLIYETNYSVIVDHEPIHIETSLFNSFLVLCLMSFSCDVLVDKFSSFDMAVLSKNQ